MTQLDYDVMKKLANIEYEVICSDIYETSTFKNYVKLDITNELAVKETLNRNKPDAVISCTAFTVVDKTEDFKEKVYAINTLEVKYIA